VGGNIVLEDQETPGSAQLNKTLNQTSASIPCGETLRTVINGASVLPELPLSLGHAEERTIVLMKLLYLDNTSYMGRRGGGCQHKK